MVKPDLFVIHTDPDPPEGTAYSERPPMPATRPLYWEGMFRTPEPMVYLGSSGRFRVKLSYKTRDGKWKLKQQTVDTLGQARRLRQWWKAVGRAVMEAR